MLLPAHLEVVHIAYTQGGPYPGVFLFTGMARMLRPVINSALGSPELIGSLEQSTLDIRSAQRCLRTGRSGLFWLEQDGLLLDSAWSRKAE